MDLTFKTKKKMSGYIIFDITNLQSNIKGSRIY